MCSGVSSKFPLTLVLEHEGVPLALHGSVWLALDPKDTKVECPQVLEKCMRAHSKAAMQPMHVYSWSCRC